MDPRFRFPMATMLAGLGVWAAFLAAHAVASAAWAAWAVVVLSGISAGLVVTSGYS